MTDNRETIAMLKVLKEQALKSHNDTAVLKVTIDSFNFVIDKAIKALETVSCIKEKCAYCPHCENCDVDDETLEIKPLEQKEKIVHCKDCKYRDYWGSCKKWDKELDAHKTFLLDENMFCGFAEIKDGE